VIVNGIVLAEDGKKMAKRLKNYPDPASIFDQFGADALRYYLLTSPVMQADNINFSAVGVQEALRKNVMVLWNVYKFYEQYAVETQNFASLPKSENVLDQWILAKLNLLIEEVTKNMNGYDLPRSVRPISEFINDFSTWYIRRSRDRFKGDDELDKQAALATTKFVLIELAKVMAPFMPFMAETIWQKVFGFNFKDEDKSVHLEKWPYYVSTPEDNKLFLPILEQMELAKKIVEAGLAARDRVGIKIRQPLPYYSTDCGKDFKLGEGTDVFVTEPSNEFIQIVKEELNVLEIRFGKDELGIELTEELRMDGVKRELVRSINAMRKNVGLTIQDKIIVYWNIAEADFTTPQVKKVMTELGKEIAKDVLAEEIREEHTMEVDLEKEVKVNGEMVWLGVKKI
jgi:isoleucyl-tRNA synthetase